jgi:hypothetical protein
MKYRVGRESRGTQHPQGLGERAPALPSSGFYLDGYADTIQVDTLLREFGFRLLNGRTLQPFVSGEFSLLAVQPDRMRRRIT